MKTKLAKKPKAPAWASRAGKKLRKDFPKFAEKIPLYSFLDPKTFKVAGYFVGQNAGSVVLKVSDKSGTYIVKSTADPKTLITEVTFLKQWTRVGANTVKVLDLIKPRKEFPFAAAVLEYIQKEITEESLLKNKKAMPSVYKKLGQGLAIMHKAKGKGFGKVINIEKLTGKYSTYGGMIQSPLAVGKKQQTTLVKNKLLEEKDIPLIAKAISVVEKDIKNGRRSSLIHDDPGVFNTFGISSLKFFDPYPKISHPFEDLAHAMIWASFYNTGTKGMHQNVMLGYGLKQRDMQILQAALFLKILDKWSWWVRRGRDEKVALTWIEKTKKLFIYAKEGVESVI